MFAKPILLIFLGLALSACMPTVVAATPSPEFTKTVAPSPSATIPAFTATSLPTSTPLPSATTTQTVTASSTSFSQGCDGSAYVRDVTIRDGTKLAPGETFTKTWELKNTGSCAWGKTYSMTFVSGDDMNGFDTEIHQFVKPGDTAEISVSLTAPDDAGTYTGYWILANKNGTPFGAKVYAQIIVSEDAATSTATSTQTSTSTATSTSVPASATPMPTDTPTSTPTATLDIISTGTPGI
jgi:Ig-like domain from next to BRCA1 gene